MTYYFGASWDAPLVQEDARQVPVPVGEICRGCKEPIAEDDRGLMRTYSDLETSAKPVHIECDMLAMIGHSFGVCACTGFGNSRADAQVLLAHVNESRRSAGQKPLW